MVLGIHKKWRLALATLIAPIFGGILFIIGLHTFTLLLSNRGLYTPFETLKIGTAFGALIGWPTMLLVGLPMHALICKLQTRHWVVYALGGGAAGALAAFSFLLAISGSFASTTEYAGLLLICGIPTGLFSAVLFHLIRGPHMPHARPTPDT